MYSLDAYRDDMKETISRDIEINISRYSMRCDWLFEEEGNEISRYI